MQLAGDSDEDASEDLNVFDSEALYASDEMVEEVSEDNDDEVEDVMRGGKSATSRQISKKTTKPISNPTRGKSARDEFSSDSDDSDCEY